MGRIATGGCGIATTTCGCPRAVGASVTPGGLPSAETTPGRVARHGHLDLLYVTVGSQSKGTGRAIWTALQARYPEVEVWQTIAPYFEKRKPPLCVPPIGFQIVEFYHQGARHPRRPGTTSAACPRGPA